MPSIDEEAGIAPEQFADKAAEELMDKEAEVVNSGGGFRLPDWFYIPRLDEPIANYREHPLNFNRGEGMAYVIRGFSALAGGLLNFWWMDVIGGVLRMRKESAAARAAIQTEGREAE